MVAASALSEKPNTFLARDEQQQAQIVDFVAALQAKTGTEIPADFVPALQCPDGSRITLPQPVFDALLKVVEAMREGLAVTVAPTHMQLTTQEVADLLGISRPTVVKLCEEGEIRYTKPGRHRRVLLRDALAYQETQRQRRSAALAEIAAVGEDLDLYDVDPGEYNAAVKAIRTARGSRSAE
jgi:excisionase family DNA binding protein